MFSYVNFLKSVKDIDGMCGEGTPASSRYVMFDIICCDFCSLAVKPCFHYLPMSFADCNLGEYMKPNLGL